MAESNLTIILFLVGTGVMVVTTGITQAGWRHKTLIWGLIGIGAALILIGAAWQQISEISPTVATLVRAIATNPASWASVIILGFCANLLLRWRALPSAIIRRDDAVLNAVSGDLLHLLDWASRRATHNLLVDLLKEQPVANKSAPPSDETARQSLIKDIQGCLGPLQPA